MKNLKHLNKYLAKYRHLLILGGIVTVVARVLSLVMPQYVEESINAVEKYIHSDADDSSQIKRHLVEYVVIIIGSTLVSAFFTFMMRQLIINVSRRIEFDLKNEIYTHYQKLSLGFYKSHRTGDLMNRISEDVNKVRMYTGPAIMYSIQTATLFICVIPLMFYTSIKLTFYTLLPLPLLSILVYYVRRSINRHTSVVQNYLSELSSFSQEIFSGIRIVKAYNAENYAEQKVKNLADEGREKALNLSRVESWFMPLMVLLIGMSGIFVIYTGGRLYISGDIHSIGVIAKFSIFVIMLTWPVATVGWVSSIVQQAEVSQRRINEFLNTKPEIVDSKDARDVNIRGDIVFDNVGFTYPDSGIEALKGVSFHIKEGETVAFLGKVGSGKTTLLDLITRLYDVSSGQIRIEGKPIGNITLSALRKHIGYVPQEAFLFSDTIRSNVLFGDRNATDEAVANVCRKASIHGDIMGFKNGYNTHIGERGVSLSGGQRQRLCIARTLLKSPKIYLFDDCLSAVDTETEEQILHNLNDVHKNLTTVIVTHRISSAKHADRIFIMANGRIEEEGTHSGLLASSAYYKMLSKNQEPGKHI